MNKEGTTYTIIFIFIVSFAFVFLLSMTNQVPSSVSSSIRSSHGRGRSSPRWVSRPGG